MTNEEIAKEIALKVYDEEFPFNLAVKEIIEALRQKELECYEKAAKICLEEQGTSCPDCGDSLLISVAELISALKPTDKEQTKK